MGQTTEQIESHIDRKRRALRSNLDELEGKVRNVADWRQYVRRNPTAMLAAAFTGGLLAASLVGRRREAAVSSASVSNGRDVSRDRKVRALRAWSNIQGALISTGAAKLQQKLAEIVPGFRENLEKVSAEGDAREHLSRPSSQETVQGEGDYRSAREYRRGVERFVHTADIDRAAREAAPRDEREAAELAAAEDRGRRGTGHPQDPGAGTSRHR